MSSTTRKGLEVLTNTIGKAKNYVRNSFGNKATPVETEDVARIRKEVKSFVGLYSPDTLLQEHPLK